MPCYHRWLGSSVFFSVSHPTIGGGGGRGVVEALGLTKEPR